MTYDYQKKFICPRLIDYLLIVGSRYPTRNNSSVQNPELLRRYPLKDHEDFPLPPDVVYFCQPEGCFNVGPKGMTLREITCFVFTLTDKDSGKIRYGICLNFFRPFEIKLEKKKPVKDTQTTKDRPPLVPQKSSTAKKKKVTKLKNNSLTSFCFLSHHPFFSSFRDCLFILKKMVEASNDRCNSQKVVLKSSDNESVWNLLSGLVGDQSSNLVLHEVRELEAWILKLLSSPVPFPGKTKLELKVLPLKHHSPLIFATPDHTRFSMVDFPLHLPLELLGVDICLKVLTLIMLENKLILQSRDYNALSMSVMAFVAMLYPLEYMFPVIPLLPTCMNNAEQLLLVPTPFIIGVPSSFLLYKKNFLLPDDVWLIDLDANKIKPPSISEEIPELPEPEGSILKNHLKQALASMSASPQPIKNIEQLNKTDFFAEISPENSSNNEFNPLIYGNDVDSVDVATRVAMVRFFNSSNTLGNLAEHTRTLRLYPRPVVAFQLHSFVRSRPVNSKFTSRLAKTQAVEYFVEWALNPTNVVFLRVHTGIYDPLKIGDKPRWFSNNLEKVEFDVYDEVSSLATVFDQSQNKGFTVNKFSEEKESDSEDGEIEDSSSSSLENLVAENHNSQISGCTLNENQLLTIDESRFYNPPTHLVVPEETSGVSEVFQQDNPVDRESSYADDDEDSSDEGEQLKDNWESSGKDEESKGNKINDQSNFNKLQSKAPPQRPPPPNPSALNRMSSLPLTTSKTSPINQMKTATKQSSLPYQQISTINKPVEEKQPSIIDSFADEINSATNKFTGLFGESLKNKITNLPNIAESFASSLVDSEQNKSNKSNAIAVNKTSKPFTPLGNRKGLMERSLLVKHTNIQKKNSIDMARQQFISDQKNQQHNENQHFLKEITTGILEGKGVRWLRGVKLKKLMEDENYRNFVVSRLNISLEKKISDESHHLEDVCISKPVFKGMISVMKAIISGLEVTFQNQGSGGLASALMLLEIIHTHYWEKEGSSKSDTSNHSLASSPFGSNEALSMMSETKSDSRNPEDLSITTPATPEVANDKEFEKTQINKQENKHNDTKKQDFFKLNLSEIDNNNNITEQKLSSLSPDVGQQRNSSEYSSESGDLLRQLVKNKDVIEKKKILTKNSSFESDASDFSSNINNSKRKRSTSSFLSSKSHLSGGYRYREGRMLNLNFPQQEFTRSYLFECLLGKERSPIWDQVQFWEDVFLDAVAQERDIIGMDQGPTEMMERYKSLNDSEKKRLEYDEDRLLGCMLHNMISFMVMMSVNKNEIKRKARRLLGKCHIGLSSSHDLNQLLDHIENLKGNDIDLKPLGSRLMQKQSFTVHWGPDNSGIMLFMEVCDDCLILRSVNGSICDRWWYEKLVNMTYCPKTKVFCLWRQLDGKSQLNRFYTKKCKELYNCVKTSMEKAASKTTGKVPGLELGSEFPVHDLKSGQGGLLQVCMEGIGLIFANSKLFIELSRIKKCFTMKGGIFVLEEFDLKNKKIIQRKYKSNMASQICYAVLCIFSYVAAGHNLKPCSSSCTTPSARPSIVKPSSLVSLTGSRTL